MIGKRIKFLRQEKGLSQAELAEALSVSRMTVNNYENEKRIPDVEFAINTADYFGVTVEYLTGKSEFRDREDFSATINKVQYLADIVETLPTEEGRQMTNSLAELFKIAQISGMSEPLMPILADIYIQLAELIMSYSDLNENVKNSADELKKCGADDELISAALKEKPMSLYAHGMVVGGNLQAFTQRFVGALMERINL